MPKTTHNVPFEHRLGLLTRRQRLLMLGVALVVVLLFFAVQAWRDLQHFNQQMVQNAERSVGMAVREIETYLQDQRRILRLFVLERRPLIEQVAEMPEDEQAMSLLKTKVQDCFPEALAFTLAAPDGRARVAVFNGLPDSARRQNIVHFAQQGGEQAVYVQSHPEGYHFDLMQTWKETPAGREIFYISFGLDRLRRILQINEAFGFRLYLTREDQPGLIEVASEGGRDHLGREDTLAAEELASSLAASSLKETRWGLHAVPVPAHTMEARAAIGTDFIQSALIVALIAILMVMMLEMRERQLARAMTREQELSADKEMLYEQATRDALTGLANRRQIDERLTREWQRALRDRHPLSLIMLDVDHFKSYNDNLGHPAGDQCLRQIGDMIRHVVHRPADLVGRYGGEEFLLLLPDTELDSAKWLAEKLRREVEDAGRPHPDGGVVTISLGVASCLPGPEGRVEDLLKAADEALYRAKMKGRNRVESAHEHKPDDDTP